MRVFYIIVVAVLCALGVVTATAPLQAVTKEEEAERLYNDAIEQFSAGQLQAARSAMSDFVRRYPYSRWTEEVIFRLADTESDFRTRVSALMKFIADYPQGKFAAEAYFNLAESYYLHRDYARALKYYSKVYNLFPESRLATEAGFRIGTALIAQKRYDDARNHFGAFLTAHSDLPWAAWARQSVADTYFEEGNYLAAEQEYLKTLEDDSSVSASTYLRLAAIYELRSEDDRALELYRAFLKKFPHSAAAASVREKLEETSSLNQTGTSGQPFYVQAGSFTERDRAESEAERFRQRGYDAFVVAAETDKLLLYHVRLGWFTTRADALQFADKLLKEENVEVGVFP